MTHTHTQPDPPRYKFEVVAKYNYSPSTAGDLPLTKGEKFTVLDSSEDWWLARNQQG